MKRTIAVLALLTLYCLLPGCTTVDSNDVTDVQRTFDTYIRSVNAADPMLGSQVWSQSDDVTAVTPFGRFQGWNRLREDLYINFLQKSFSERHLEPSNVSIRVAGDTAWAVFDWAFTAKLTDGKPFQSKGWESHVYRRTDGRWTIVHLHYSGALPAS
jgi:ketosteroid isomerase-like protein